MPKNRKRPFEDAAAVGRSLEPSWWWRRRDTLHKVFRNSLADDPAAVRARLKPLGRATALRLEREEFSAENTRRLFEAEFEASAWMYEAHRRFHDQDLPAYPKLSYERRRELAEIWPCRGLETHITSGIAERPHKGWTRFLNSSFNLRVNTNVLCEIFRRFILDERQRLKAPEPRPGRPHDYDWQWKVLEGFDIAERVKGYKAGDDGFRSLLSKARKLAPSTLSAEI